jgi:pSer/pThr/pTyr-binding forkhead associated (FHA) protein
MHVKLKVLRGASSGKEVAVNGPRFLIGRSEECHLRANSDAISRQHCAITVESGLVKVRDLGSRNGTYVNGDRIHGEHLIRMGDELRVGPLEFLVTYLKSAAKTPVKPKGSDSSILSEDEMAGLIDDWLSEGKEPGARAAAAASETREFRLDETNRIDVPEKPKKKAKAKPVETEAAKSDGTGAEVEREPILPTRQNAEAKPAPKDTQEAAAQTLRKFFNRGG